MKKYILVFEEPKVGTFEGERETNFPETLRIGEHINLEGLIYEIVDIIYEGLTGKIYVKQIDSKPKYLSHLFKKVNGLLD